MHASGASAASQRPAFVAISYLTWCAWRMQGAAGGKGKGKGKKQAVFGASVDDIW